LQIHCCEPSPDACARLRKRFPQVNLYETWLQEISGNELYDAITLWDTLEHIGDLSEFSNTVNRLLKPGGYWFFSTPNTNSFEWTVMGTEHVQILPPGHINLFNPKSAECLLKRHGFEVVEIQTPNGSLDVSYVEKNIGMSDVYDTNIGRFLINNLRNEKFKDQFVRLISDTQRAGNIFVIARKLEK
jgi:hypothetical protein